MRLWILAGALFLIPACGDSGGEFENNVPQGFERGSDSREHAPSHNEGWHGENSDGGDGDAGDGDAGDGDGDPCAGLDACSECICREGANAAVECLDLCT